MAVRSTMTRLMQLLRGLTNAGTADYTIGLFTYWSNDHIQDALDRHSVFVKDEPLYPKKSLDTGGVISYYDYQSKYRFFESTDGGTLRFIVKDSTGTAQTGWTANYENGEITFSTDQAGAVYYLTGTSFDVYAAAADVWYQKAAHAADMIDFSTDGHNIKRSHLVRTALKMAQRYESMADAPVGSTSIGEMVRSDLQ